MSKSETGHGFGKFATGLSNKELPAVVNNRRDRNPKGVNWPDDSVGGDVVRYRIDKFGNKIPVRSPVTTSAATSDKPEDLSDLEI
jgi:hypothetical protein